MRSVEFGLCDRPRPTETAVGRAWVCPSFSDIVAKCGGSVRFENYDHGHGARFVAELPASTKAQGAVAAELVAVVRTGEAPGLEREHERGDEGEEKTTTHGGALK